MVVKRFNVILHRQHIRNWLEIRHMNADMSKELPDIGFMAFSDKDEPLAAGFLRKCEGNYVLVDGLINNPHLPGEVRAQANDAVITQLINIAKELKFKAIWAFTGDDNTRLRALRHGFKELPETMLAFPL